MLTVIHIYLYEKPGEQYVKDIASRFSVWYDGPSYETLSLSPQGTPSSVSARAAPGVLSKCFVSHTLVADSADEGVATVSKLFRCVGNATCESTKVDEALATGGCPSLFFNRTLSLVGILFLTSPLLC